MAPTFAPAPGAWIEDTISGVTVRYLRTAPDGRFVVDDGEYSDMGEYRVPAADYGPEGTSIAW